MNPRYLRTSLQNIPWLTDLPDHWGVARSKSLFSVRKEYARPTDEQLSATQAYGVISQKEFERRVGRKVTQITRHPEKRRHVERDDFVISMRSFQGGLERAWESGCIRSSYVVLKPSAEVHVGYFARLFKSHDYIQALRATANFIRDGQDLNFNNFCLDTWEKLDRINWDAVAATDFRDMLVKEGKQAEFLIFEAFPWALVEKIGVIDQTVQRQVQVIVAAGGHEQPPVAVERGWYY